MSNDSPAQPKPTGKADVNATQALPTTTPTSQRGSTSEGATTTRPSAPKDASFPKGSPTPRDTSVRDTSASGPSGAPQAAPVTRVPGDRRPSVPRPAPARGDGRSAPARGRGRRARLALRRIDPWSVFLFSFLGSLCLGVVLLVAVGALYAMLSSLGVVGSINDVVGEVTGGGPDSGPVAPLLTAGRALSAAGVLALIDVVLLTALATLGALLYNLCASLTGGIEVTLTAKD